MIGSADCLTLATTEADQACTRELDEEVVMTTGSFLKSAVLIGATILLIQGVAVRPQAFTTAVQLVEPQAADGSLDPSFGSGGKVTSDFSGRADFAHALAIQSDGRILLAG